MFKDFTLMKKMIIVFVLLLLICIAMGAVDFYRVSHFEMPVFAQPIITADDGGSGTYEGIGYYFSIEGNFMPDAEFPGIQKYEGYIFDKMVLAAIRN